MAKAELVIEQVEEFIKDFKAKNVILTSEAQKTMVPIAEGKDGLGRTKKETYSLADLIGNEVFAYDAIMNSFVISKDKELRKILGTPSDMLNVDLAINRRRDEVAHRLLKYVEIARSNNVLDYPKLSEKAQKFDALEKEYEKLNGEHTKLLKLYNESLRENRKLVKDNKILNGFDRKENKHTDSDFESGVQGT